MIRERRDTASWPLWRKGAYKVYRSTVGSLYRRLILDPRRERLAVIVSSLPPSPPVPPNPSWSAHMLVCRRDVTMAVCTGKAANLAFDMALPWIFHDDGSLSDADVERLEMHFPGARVVRRAEADRHAEERLAAYPRILDYRKHQVMALKLVDVKLWSRGERTAYIDSDIVFFRMPEFFIRALSKDERTSYFNRDISSGYVRPAHEIERLTGVRPFDRANAGLWVMSSDVLDLDVIESWLEHPAFAGNLYDYKLDQTFISMLANRDGFTVRHLPETYDVAFRKNVRSSVNKHYVGRIRHGFELEGLAYLLNGLAFEQRWFRFARHRSTRETAPERVTA